MAKQKKPKSVDELFADALIPKKDQPYEIPSNWVWANLGAIAQWGSGGTPSRGNSSYYQGNIPWVKTGELNKNIIYDTEEKITQLGLKNSSAKIYPKGSIVIAMYGATIGKVSMLGMEASTNQACAVAITHEQVNTKYLFNYLRAQKNNFIALGKGGAQPNISQMVIKKHHFPLPPLSEQKRIVTKLSAMLGKLKQAKELIQEAKDSFEKRRAAILHLAFTGELTKEWRGENKNITNDFKKDQTSLNTDFKIPKSWVSLSFGKIASIKSNLVDPADFMDYPHIAPNYIEKNTGELLDYKSIAEDGVKSPKHFFEKGDIIYSKIRPYLSKLIIATFEGLCSADMYPIETVLNTSFLFNYMLSPIFLDYATNAGSRTVLPKINQKELNRIPVICPPSDEQAEIVRILDDLLGKETEASSLLELENEIDLLEKSILSKAFRGELDTNDPDDESAEDLLKKILQEKQKKEATTKKKSSKRVTIKAKPIKIGTSVKATFTVMKDKKKSILEILKGSKTAMPAKEVWQNSRHNDDIETFYAELKTIEDQLVETKKGKVSTLKLKK